MYLATTVIAVLIPSLLVGGWLAARSAASERAHMEGDIQQKVRQVASALDHEVHGMTGVLVALASSQYLYTGELSEFYRQATDVANQLGVHIILLDLQLDQVVNTIVPWGTPLPTRGMFSRDSFSAVIDPLRAGKAVVSDVLFGPLINKNAAVVAVPVMREGRPVYFLGMVVPTDRFAELWAYSQLRKELLGTIIDRNNTIVARSQRHGEFSGKKTRLEPTGGSAAREGVLDRPDLEGTATYRFWLRSESTGWVVSVGIPERILNAPSALALASYSAAGVLFLCAGLLAAHRFGGRVSEELGALEAVAILEREQARSQFAVLVESAPNGVIGLDEAGVIAAVNSQMEKIFGYDRAELIGKSVEFLIPDRLREAHRSWRTAFSAAPEARLMGAGFDLFGQKKDGREFPVDISLSVLRNGAGILLLASVVDITERKRAEEKIADTLTALRTSEQRRQFSAEAGGIGLWSVDLATGERWWSDEFRRILDIPPDAASNRGVFYRRLHPRDRSRVRESFDRFVVDADQFEHEFRIRQTEDNAPRWVSIKGRIDREANGNPAVAHGIIQDITARKTAEQQRDELRLRLVQIQEQERLRLAQELHDETGQMLTAALLELKGIEAIVDPGAQAKLQSLRDHLGQIGGKLHRIAWDLRPASINELGLETATSNYVSEWSARTGIDASFVCGDSHLDELPDTVRTTVYRIVQEAMTNIAKHAPTATAVSVTISRVDGELRVNIEDDGPGIAPAEERDGRQRLGIAGIRERLTLIGGQMEIETSPAVGTSLYVRIRVQEEEAA